MAEHTVAGVRFRVGMIGPHPTDPAKKIHACELLVETRWAAVRALRGQKILGIGDVLDAGGRLVDPMPVGARFSIVTAAGGA
jgi:hypothetical protein